MDFSNNPLEGLRCPACHQNDRFVIQLVQNVVVMSDGLDSNLEPGDDCFEDRPIDPEAGLRDGDPIRCFGRYCGHRATVAEFRMGW